MFDNIEVLFVMTTNLKISHKKNEIFEIERQFESYLKWQNLSIKPPIVF